MTFLQPHADLHPTPFHTYPHYMQTFLPYKDFTLSASVLDTTRLGNQRNETTVILQTLDEIETKGVKPQNVPWGTHPAVRMWHGYRRSLTRYGLIICLEYRSRGFADTVLDKLAQKQREYRAMGLSDEDPWWLGLPALHKSHQSSLTAKEPSWYKAFWDTPATMPTFWPVGPEITATI